MDRHIRIAAAFLSVGILVEIVSLRWSHPLAFIVFVGVGGLLMLIGIVVYLRAAFLAKKTVSS